MGLNAPLVAGPLPDHQVCGALRGAARPPPEGRSLVNSGRGWQYEVGLNAQLAAGPFPDHQVCGALRGAATCELWQGLCRKLPR